MNEEVIDYRGRQTQRMKPRTCVECDTKYLEVCRSLSKDTCPPCRVVSGRCVWRTCRHCGVDHATWKAMPSDTCRQCSLSGRPSVKDRPDKPQRIRAPVSLAQLEPEAFFALETSGELLSGWEKIEHQEAMAEWRRPLTQEELSARRRAGLSTTITKGGYSI